MTLQHLKSAIILSASVALTSASSAKEQPNILFIFADDHAYDCVASHGNSEIDTPNLDKLTKNGTRFYACL